MNKVVLIIFALLNSIIASTFPDFLTASSSNVIDSKLKFRKDFLDTIDNVSIFITYYYSEGKITEFKAHPYDQFQTKIAINIPKDDNTFWNNFFYKGIDKICINDTTKLSYSVGCVVNLLFHIQLHSNKSKLDIYFPSWNVKGGCGLSKVNNTLYFFIFKEKFLKGFKEYLIRLMDITIPKDYTGCDFD